MERFGGSTRYAQAAVVVPAHNERDDLPRCLRALVTAAAGAPVPVTIAVVLDACSDGSANLSGEFGWNVHFVEVDAGCVGAARAAGFRYLRAQCGLDDRTWFATTDADSEVDADWLVRQLAVDADMVLGVVRVGDWRRTPADVIDRYLRGYRSSEPEHLHIHGANMSFRAKAYWQVGGFRGLTTGEDVELVARFERAGMRIRRDARLSVRTSARRTGRAPGGFAAHLRDLARHSRIPVQDPT